MKKIKAFIARKILAAKTAVKRKSGLTSSTRNLILFSVETQQAYTDYVKSIELLDDTMPAYDAIILTTDEIAPKFLFHPSRKVVSNKELNFFSLPKKDIASQFNNKSYKYLINCCSEDCLALDFFATIINAQIKISIFKEEKLKIYDFLLNPDSDHHTDSFLKLVLKYLHKINYPNE